jgi:hypothetical protein
LIISGSVLCPNSVSYNMNLLGYPLAYGFTREFGGQSAMKRAFPDGTYSLTMQTINDGEHQIPVALVGGNYPTRPRFTSLIAMANLNWDRDVTIAWDSIADGTSNDSIQLSFGNGTFNTPVFTTPSPGQPGALDGHATAVTIPANTLMAAASYFVSLIFYRAVDVDTNSYPGALGYAARASATMTIAQMQHQTQTGPGAIVFSSRRFRVSEAAGAATITVARVLGDTLPVSVSYRTVARSAIDGVDYVHSTGTLSFEAGQTSQTFTVPILDNATPGSNRVLRLELFDPTNLALLPAKGAYAILQILDDD